MDSLPLKDSIFDYFDRKTTLPPGDEASKLAIHYLDQGLIDSMGIVELVTDFEAMFGIQFTADDLQSPDFQTIGGLVAIVTKRVHDK